MLPIIVVNVDEVLSLLLSLEEEDVSGLGIGDIVRISLFFFDMCSSSPEERECVSLVLYFIKDDLPCDVVEVNSGKESSWMATNLLVFLLLCSIMQF
jgi:hypothetical protein